ncbi:hypothetical protein HD554DRAFT_2036188 [Boletus coccyginus]|nr:hypothetical protein HD554DRAFT_2036188 [Boletus coccyginus]
MAFAKLSSVDSLTRPGRCQLCGCDSSDDSGRSLRHTGTSWSQKFVLKGRRTRGLQNPRNLRSLVMLVRLALAQETGTIEPCSIHNQVKVGAIHLDADNLHHWLLHFKNVAKNIPVPPPGSLDVRVQVMLKRMKQNVKKIGRYKYNVVFEAATCSCELSNTTLHGVSLHGPSGVAQSDFPILSVGSTSVDAMLADWPSMLSLPPSPCCDANPSPVFREDAPRRKSEPLFPTVISPVPRIAVNVRVDVPLRALCVPMFPESRGHSLWSWKLKARWGSECTSTETLFSMETVEANGMSRGFGEANDDDQFVSTTLDTRTTIVDLHCCTEAGVVELWHPQSSECAAVAAFRPFAFIATGKIPSFLMNITSGLCPLFFCCTRHVFPPSQPHSQVREKLSLVPESSGTDVIVGKLVLWNMTMHAVASDEFSMDDPHTTERDSPFLNTKQLLSVVNVDVGFTPKDPMDLPAGVACNATFSEVDDALTL